VRQEPLSQGLDGCLDPVSEGVEGSSSFGLGGLGPPLKPWRSRVLGFEPGLVGHQPQQDEVWVDLVSHHGLEVELHVGLAGEGDVVPEDPEAMTVRDHPPQVLR
jgi:hypothetical protein